MYDHPRSLVKVAIYLVAALAMTKTSFGQTVLSWDKMLKEAIKASGKYKTNESPKLTTSHGSCKTTFYNVELAMHGQKLDTNNVQHQKTCTDLSQIENAFLQPSSVGPISLCWPHLNNKGISLSDFPGRENRHHVDFGVSKHIDSIITARTQDSTFIFVCGVCANFHFFHLFIEKEKGTTNWYICDNAGLNGKLTNAWDVKNYKSHAYRSHDLDKYVLRFTNFAIKNYLKSPTLANTIEMNGKTWKGGDRPMWTSVREVKLNQVENNLSTLGSLPTERDL